MLTNDVHVMSLNSCDIRSNYLNLFKGVSADISVAESDCCSVWWDLYETEQSKTQTMRFVGIVASGLFSGNYYNGEGASDIYVLKTSKSTWHSVRTSQRTPRAWNRIHSLLLQVMWESVFSKKYFITPCVLHPPSVITQEFWHFLTWQRLIIR
jgi:hypothetical protein